MCVTHREDLLPIVEVTVSMSTALLTKSTAMPALQAFYTPSCLQQLLRCLQYSMLPLNQSMMAMLLQDDEDFYPLYVGMCGATYPQQGSCYRKAVLSLFETLAKQHSDCAVQYMQEEFQSLDRLGERELFGFLCMIERGCGYVSKSMSYDAVFASVVQPVLSNPSSPALCVMECVLICDVCFHLFSDANRSECIQFCIEKMGHAAIAVQLTAVEALNHIIHNANCNLAVVHHLAASIVESLLRIYQVAAWRRAHA